MPREFLQESLFDLPQDLGHGLVYRPGFLSADEESALIERLATLPLSQARYQQYTARRRVVRFGEGDFGEGDDRVYDASAALPFPEFLVGLRRRAAQWCAIPETALAHALVTEYRPGTPIGWHRDAPLFERIVGISLGSEARMRFRPYAALHGRKAGIELRLAPRSAYVMQGDIRWHWEHHLPPVKSLRYSITLRSLMRGRAPPA